MTPLSLKPWELSWGVFIQTPCWIRLICSFSVLVLHWTTSKAPSIQSATKYLAMKNYQLLLGQETRYDVTNTGKRLQVVRKGFLGWKSMPWSSAQAEPLITVVLHSWFHCQMAGFWWFHMYHHKYHQWSSNYQW